MYKESRPFKSFNKSKAPFCRISAENLALTVEQTKSSCVVYFAEAVHSLNHVELRAGQLSHEAQNLFHAHLILSKVNDTFGIVVII